MIRLPSNMYAQWRAHRLASLCLQDAGSKAGPTEQLLQAVWQQQRIDRSRLRTLDDLPVKILHPGFWNHQGGPDFKGAVIQVGADAAVTGDIEIDLEPAGWTRHGHHRNPAFAQVVLHVIWQGKKPVAGALPTMPLCDVLDAPLDELTHWLASDAWDPFLGLAGQCQGPLKGLNEATLAEVLRQAAQVRFQSKAAHFLARARLVGTSQALWEGLMRALGYQHNVWPMQRLAELTRSSNLSGDATPLGWQARLLGAGGLLPAELTRTQAGVDRYLGRVWDVWWRERAQWAEDILPRQTWRVHGLRPSNHPQRRLALAAHWLSAGALPGRLASWLDGRIDARDLTKSLHGLLRVDKDDFWSWHYTLRSKKLSRPLPLLGEGRLTDLAINVVLPWAWGTAWAGKQHGLCEEAGRRFHHWPAGEDNAVLKLARQRLFSGGRMTLRTAAQQQGLLQIVRDFCEHSNALCDGCQFPGLVSAIAASRAASTV